MSTEVKNQNQGESGQEHRGVPRSESKATQKLKAKPSFTPGPWPLETVVTQVGVCHKIGAFPALYRREKVTYACVYDDGGTLKHPDPTLAANARLIAAAPALYAALTTLTRVVKALDKRAPMSEKEYNAFCDGLNGADAALALTNGQHTS